MFCLFKFFILISTGYYRRCECRATEAPYRLFAIVLLCDSRAMDRHIAWNCRLRSVASRVVKSLQKTRPESSCLTFFVIRAVVCESQPVTRLMQPARL